MSKRTVFQHFIEVLEMFHNDGPMFFQDGKCDEEVEIRRQEIRP